MDYAELLIQYNGFFLIFNSIGFLISLLWFLMSENSKRRKITNANFSTQDLFDEKKFFDNFDDIKNPALDDTQYNDDQGSEDSDSILKIRDKNFKSSQELPIFPILKTEVKDKINKEEANKKFFSKGVKKDKEKTDDEDVEGLLVKIKKDIEKGKK